MSFTKVLEKVIDDEHLSSAQLAFAVKLCRVFQEDDLVSATIVGMVLNVDRTLAWRRLKELENFGYIEEIEMEHRIFFKLNKLINGDRK